MDVKHKILRVFTLKSGEAPFLSWIREISDLKTQSIIKARLARVRVGNFGDSKYLSEGISELKIDYGAGIRIYFGQDGDELVILLCGGIKRTQSADIKLAKSYWAMYKQEKKYANY